MLAFFQSQMRLSARRKSFAGPLALMAIALMCNLGFSAPSAQAFDISGRVTNAAGQGVADVKIESTGEINDGVFTDASGFYTLTGAASGAYTLVADKDGTTFNPSSLTVQVLNANVTGANFVASGVGAGGDFSISGRVLNSVGGGVSGVKIESTGEVNDGVFTDAGGNYMLTGAGPGTYVITPDKTNTSFTPQTRSVTINNANVTGVNFTASGGGAGAGFIIRGRVVNDSGVPVSGVRIESTGEIDDGVLTDANGNYILNGAAPGTYTITPDRDNTQFSPPSRTVTVSTANVTNVNFTAYGGASVGRYAIRGRVLNAAGQPVPGVRIESTGEVNDGVQTDLNGFYTLTGVSPGTYVITPDKKNVRCTPVVRNVSVTNASVNGVNFTAVTVDGGNGNFTISGRVVSSNGAPVSGVRIESSGQVNDGVLTNANGTYVLTGVAAGNYVITPDKDNTAFRPLYRSVSVTNANVTNVNFTAYGGAPSGSLTISGRVLNGAGVPVAGVRIESTGEVNDGILTDANGNYTLTGVAPGTYTITPDKNNTRFTPQKSTVTVNNASLTGVNFTAAPA